MALNKSIVEIIQVQNSCRSLIQELYNYETRPNDTMRDSYQSAKIDDAIHLDIIEYDNIDDELSLSPDTEEYYKTRLGQNSETTIGSIDEQLLKLKYELNYYNKRVTAKESADKEIRIISKILNKLPTLLKYNLYALTSNSIFAFKNEPNFEIKMDKLEISKVEIKQLIDASINIDKFLKEQQHFFKSMNNPRINFLILKINKNSLDLESSFMMLYEDIKRFINKSVKDGEFIKKLQKLRELKQQQQLFEKTDIEEQFYKKSLIVDSIRERKLHPDDRLFDYIDTVEDIIKNRKIELQDRKGESDLSYDIDEVIKIEKTLYNYPKLHKAFLSQDEDLATFLLNSSVDRSKLLGVFIRLIKNYFLKYEIDTDNFVVIDKRNYVIVRRL
jgi:hypothetical protein